jgi:hypothetical protein
MKKEKRKIGVLSERGKALKTIKLRIKDRLSKIKKAQAKIYWEVEQIRKQANENRADKKQMERIKNGE